MKRNLSLVLILTLLIGSTTSAFADESTNFNNIDYRYSEVESSIIEALDLNSMSDSELEIFYNTVDKEIDKLDFSSSYERIKFRDEVILLLTTNQNSLKLGTNKIQFNEFAHRESQFVRMHSMDALIQFDVELENKTVATAINVMISLIIGGAGFASIGAYIKSVGVKEAERIFTRTLKSKLIAWGAPKIASTITPAVTILMTALDPGTAAAEWLDEHDYLGTTGSLEIHIEF